jgi:hypothetical protein
LRAAARGLTAKGDGEGRNAWDYFSHDQARDRGYRWGEDGLAGISKDQQGLCFALALGTGQDLILKKIRRSSRMPRVLTVLFRRDPERDQLRGEVPFEGYQISWPDGRAVDVGLNAFCKHGLRLLGLKDGRNGESARLVELICFPVTGRDANLTRLPGHRIRRFCLVRQGRRGRLHFLNDFPTEVVFDLDRDDPAVLAWIGLSALPKGERQWLDLAARDLEANAVGAGCRTSCGHEAEVSGPLPGCQSAP